MASHKVRETIQITLITKARFGSTLATTAEVAKEVLDYLKSEHSYGNKDTRMGKSLEKRFGGTPYGWERDMLRLILAALFRAGEIEEPTYIR